MKKTNILFIIWGVIVFIVIVLLTVLGFMLKKVNKDYRVLENDLKVSAEKYVTNNFLFPNENEQFTITKEKLIEEGYLEDLKTSSNDVCDGYAIVKMDDVVKTKAYIKCDKYTTKGYNKKG